MTHFDVARAVWNEQREEYDYQAVGSGLDRAAVDRLVRQAGDMAYELVITEYEDAEYLPGLHEAVATSHGEMWPEMDPR